ncbi:EAL domain-containing protein [Vibrio parahaemolyticus]|nr:EAL domain-containing protein [Vibrio parahaemolyticus]EJE8775173.1 EAL domain-containing protein [Vibrio parahaemolyticus]
MYNSIFFVFQPKLKNGSIYGYEALIRASNGDGVAFPSAMMEKHSNDPYFDYFIINKAVKQVCRTPSLFGYNVSINVSAQFICLLDIELLSFNLSSLPFELEFEVLEDTKIFDFSLAKKNMDWLQAKGIKVSTDDFGCDYSSIERLWYLDFDLVKIDRTLISKVDLCPLNQKRVRDLVNYLRASFSVEILAEGVESRLEHKFLTECGINYFQGFYLGRPIEVFE